jgi:dolichol-phosphate mannosyltransferase
LRILAILPSYNEIENAVPLSLDVLAADPRIDVLVVDDGSPDGTADAVRKAASEEPRLHLLEREGKLGLGSAYMAGFRFGLEHDYGLILTMDCDYSHHPRYLPSILAAAEHADVVIGSRYVPLGGIINWPMHRRILSWFANAYTRVLLRVPVRDCTAGFRCYRRAVLEAIDTGTIRSSGYAFLEEMVLRVHRAGFSLTEVPIIFEDRTRGASKINHSEIYRAAWHVLVSAIRPPPSTRSGGGRRPDS